MISINDVKDGELFNTESNQWIKVKEIKEKWNSMSFHDRKFYEVPNVRKPALYADEMLSIFLHWTIFEFFPYLIYNPILLKLYLRVFC